MLASASRWWTVIAVTIVMMGTGTSVWLGLGESAASAASGRTDSQPTAPTPSTGTHSRSDLSCALAFLGRQVGSLTKTTSAGPTGSTVLPGQTITVTLTWSSKSFWGYRPAKSEDCVRIGSRVSTLSQVHRPGPAGGSDTFSYQVPAGGTDGQQICDRGAVWAGDEDPWGLAQGDRQGSGQGPGNGWGRDDPDGGFDEHVQTSAIICYTILAAAAPEAPMAVLLPVAGLLAGGGGLLLARRRQHRRGLHRETEVNVSAE